MIQAQDQVLLLDRTGDKLAPVRTDADDEEEMILQAAEEAYRAKKAREQVLLSDHSGGKPAPKRADATDDEERVLQAAERAHCERKERQQAVVLPASSGTHKPSSRTAVLYHDAAAEFGPYLGSSKRPLDSAEDEDGPAAKRAAAPCTPGSTSGSRAAPCTPSSTSAGMACVILYGSVLLACFYSCCSFACMHPYENTCMYACLYACLYACACMYACIHACMFVCIRR